MHYHSHWFTAFIANLLWQAHIIADPDYESIPGLTAYESEKAAGVLFYLCYRN